MWHTRRRVHSINNQHAYQTFLLQCTHTNKIGVLLKVGTLYKGFMQEFPQPCRVLCIFWGKKIFEFGYFIQVFKWTIIGCDVIKRCISFGNIYDKIHNKVYYIFLNTTNFAHPLTCWEFDRAITVSAIFYFLKRGSCADFNNNVPIPNVSHQHMVFFEAKSCFRLCIST